MAERKVETRLVLSGEQEYKAALKSVNSEIAALKSSLAAVSSEYRNNANTMQALTAKGEALSKLYDAQKTKVGTLETAVEDARKALAQYMATMGESEESDAAKQRKINDLTREINRWEIQLNKAKVELNGLDDQMADNNKYLDEAKTSADGCATSIDQYGRKAKDAGDKVSSSAGKVRAASEDVEQFGEAAAQAGDDAKDMGDKSKQAIDAIAAALASEQIKRGVQEISEVLTDCKDRAESFESQMAEVFTLLPDATAEAKENMSKDMLEFSRDLKVLTDDSIPALYQAISAGVPEDNVFDFLTIAQKAAKGGVTELETAVDGLTSVTNAYGAANMSAEKAADIMFTTVKLGKTDFNQLSSSLYNVVPTAVSAGVSFEDIGAALAAMTAQGVPTAQSTTKLRQMLVELTDTGGQVDKTFREIAGKSFKEFIKEGNNIQDVLKLLEKSATDSSLGVDELFSSVEAGSAALLLTGEATDKLTSALAAMETSAGATEAAYSTMADTSAEKTARLENALNNLEIAVGSTLLDAVGNLQDAGSGLLEQAAEFVSENQWLVPLVSGLATGLGILAVAVAGYQIAVTSVIPAIVSFNAALAANPAGLVVTAVVTLGTALAAMASFLKKGKDATEEYTKASRGLKDTLEETAAAQEETERSMDSSAQIAGIYVTQLRDLEIQIRRLTSRGEDATAVQKEYAVVVDLLNEEMPELNLAIDEQTGLLTESLTVVQAQTDAWIANEKAKAYQETFGDIIRAQAEAEMELQMNEDSLFEAQQRRAVIEQTITELREKYNQLEDEAIQISGESQEAEAAHLSLMQETADKLRELSIESEELYNKEGILTASIRENKDALADANDTVEAAKEAYLRYEESATQASATQDEIGDKIPEFNERLDSVQTALDELSEQYDATRESARKSIDSQIGLFDDMAVEVDMSVGDMIESLQSQIEYMDNYAANMQRAMELGVDDGLLAKLSDGSTESAAILQAIVEDGGENIDALNANFRRVEEGKDDFSAAIADAETDFKNKTQEIRADFEDCVAELDQYSEAQDNASETMQGAIGGIYSRVQELRNAYGYAAQQASAAYNSNLILRGNSRLAIDGSHAGGLDYVPFDGYIAELHKGEKVLTAEEAKQYVELQIPTGWDRNPARAATQSSGKRPDKIVMEIPIYNGQQLTRKEIVEIALEGIERGQIDEAISKGEEIYV